MFNFQGVLAVHLKMQTYAEHIADPFRNAEWQINPISPFDLDKRHKHHDIRWYIWQFPAFWIDNPLIGLKIRLAFGVPWIRHRSHDPDLKSVILSKRIF